MSSPTSSLETLLHHACRRAMGAGLSFTNRIRLYRSIVAMTREVRLRFGGALFDQGNQALAALLAAVCENAAELGLDPELPIPDSILLQRLAVQLSRAARRAGGIDPAAQVFCAQHPLHREEPAPPQAEATPEPADSSFSPQHAMHPEDAASDDRLSAWRADHTTERDQRAHQLLRTVIEDRVFTKIAEMNKRDREQSAAEAQADATWRDRAVA